MKKLVFFMAVLALSVNIFANGLSLNSVGPKALGMGGAFVGLADDPTAIYWNPAGLIGQENGLNVSIARITPSATYQYDAAGIDAEAIDWSHYTPNLFMNYNFDKLSLGLGVYVPSGLGVKWDGADLQAFSAIPGAYAGDPDIKYRSQIAILNFSPAIAYKVDDTFSLGAAANIYYGMFDLDRFAVTLPLNETTYKAFQYEESSTGMGFGYTLSALYKFNEMINLGVTVRSSTTVTMSGEADNDAMPLIAGAYGLAAEAKSDFDRDVTWPLWLAGGICVKPFDKFLFTFDAQYSRWSEVDKFETEFDDDGWKAITGQSGDDEFILNWEDKTQIRLGLQYEATKCLDIRAGYYYDPAPAPDETMNILFPSGTYNVITAGLGYDKGTFNVDFGLEYLIGEDRDIEATVDNMPGIHGIDIMALSLGLGYKF